MTLAIGFRGWLSFFIFFSVFTLAQMPDHFDPNKVGLSTYRQDWQIVDSLISKKLPRSALTIVKEIAEQADQDNNTQQMLKAIFFELHLIQGLEGTGWFSKTLETIRQLEAKLVRSKFPVRPVLQSMLAESYAGIYRPKKNNEPATPEDSSDVTTWSNTRLLRKVESLYQSSLTHKEALQQLSLNGFESILIRRSDKRYLRPTLFDLLSHRALDFYETKSLAPSYNAEFPDTLYFASDSVFLDSIEARRGAGLALPAPALIFADLIRFHKKSTTKAIQVELQLERYKFVHKQLSPATRDSLYAAKLHHLYYSTYRTEASIRVALDLGELQEKLLQGYSRDWTIYNKRIDDVLKDIVYFFPEQPEADRCKYFRERIRESYFAFEIERVVIPDHPFLISLTYKSVPEIHIRLIRSDPEHLQSVRSAIIDSAASLVAHNKWIRYYSLLRPIHEWRTTLPGHEDLRRHVTEISMPALEPGHYIVLISSSPQFSASDQTILTGKRFWVSNLGYVIQTTMDSTSTLFVFDRKNGLRRPGVQVQISGENIDAPSWEAPFVADTLLVTDKDGKIVIPKKYGIDSRYDFEIELADSSDRLVTWAKVYAHGFPYNADRIYRKVDFFLDRSIYRPGQMMHFKGVLSDRYFDRDSLITHHTDTVFITDANREVVYKEAFETNEYGSFSGSFVLPEDVLPGQFTIRTRRAIGNKRFRVEFYKRPQFDVVFYPVDRDYQQGDSILVRGIARGYAGQPIADASVSINISQRLEFSSGRDAVYGHPAYGDYYWFQPITEEDLKTTTNETGEFKISFAASPIAGVPEDSLAMYEYEIAAEVVDKGGETRFAVTTAIVSTISRRLALDLPSLVFANENFHLKAYGNDLYGRLAPVKGRLVIRRLLSPNRSLRYRTWDTPDQFTMPEEVFRDRFPHDPYRTENNISQWEHGEIVYDQKIDAERKEDLEIKVDKDWQAGMYVAEWHSIDKRFRAVSTSKYFPMVDRRERSLPYKCESWMEVSQTEAEPGDTLRIFWGSSHTQNEAQLTIHFGNRQWKQLWVSGDEGLQEIKVPVQESYRNNFTISILMIKNGRTYSYIREISTPGARQPINISWDTFRDRLTPGKPEEWRLRVSTAAGKPATVEAAATLYDASLDKLDKHDWKYTLEFNRRMNYSAYNADLNSFKTIRDYGTPSHPLRYRRAPLYGYDILNWSTTDGGGLIRRINLPRYDGNKSDSTDNDDQIMGYVYDAHSGEALPGVNVNIEGTTLGGATDFDGFFLIKTPPGLGRVKIRCSFIGYQSLILEGAPGYAIEAYLQESVIEGEGVLITASRPFTESMLANSVQAIEEDSDQPVISRSSDHLRSNHLSSDFKMRRDFNETAFFYPHLRSDSSGIIRIPFTPTDGLTSWQFMAAIHDKNLATTIAKAEAISEKPLMIIANPPRFLLQGDSLTLTAKLINASAAKQRGFVKLELRDSYGNTVDSTVTYSSQRQQFELGPGETRTFSWPLFIESNLAGVTYRLQAVGNHFSDGEENHLPVHPRGIKITETLPLTVPGGTTRTFELASLTDSSSSSQKNHLKLTFNFNPNPVWNILQAFPYLLEFPYDCAEQTMSRLTANILALSLLDQYPQISKTLAGWRSTSDSTAKTATASPWMKALPGREAQRQEMARLFDRQRLVDESIKALEKLDNLQNYEGSFPWFSGQRPSLRITQQVVVQLAHLKQIGINLKTLLPSRAVSIQRITDRSLRFLDGWAAGKHQRILSADRDPASDHLTTDMIQYLYLRSIFHDLPVKKSSREAYTYWQKQLGHYYLRYNSQSSRSIQMQALTAITLYNFGEKEKAQEIVRSLQEHATSSSTEGMFWPGNSGGYGWYDSSLETQAYLIATYSTVTPQSKDIESMKHWLLNRKRGVKWSTTKSTATACYALLLAGDRWLKETRQPTVIVGNHKLVRDQITDKVEAGSGYFEKEWSSNVIVPAMGKLAITQHNTAPGWGSLNWEYLEDIENIEASSDSTMAISRHFFLQAKDTLLPLTRETRLKPGDLIVVQLLVKTKRDLDFVHLSNSRPAGLEPTEIYSTTKRQGNTSYYRAISDSKDDFFIEHLPSGRHTLQYDLRVVHAGQFSSGIATVQCMYAPEYSAHTGSQSVRVIGLEESE